MRAVARAEAGCDIVGVQRSAMAETAEAVALAGRRFLELRLDVAERATPEKVVDGALGEFGRLDILVNNAGIIRRVEAVELQPKDWDDVLDVNLSAALWLSQAAARHWMDGASGGKIINIASISRAGNMGQSNYSAAKAGVSALVPVWAKELARYGIRCMGIAPGFIETEMTASMKPEALEKMTAGIPLKRMGKPEEIASAVAFIFENDYVSGRMIEVDGALRL